MSTPSSDPAPGRRTVLIVEDDPGTRHVLSSGLATTLGMFDVLTAEHGQEALELLDRGPVDVVVTDLAMPIMDGFALIGALSNRAAAPPVIVLSALAPTTVSDGLDGYAGLTVLRKPTGYAEVARAVLDTLERHALGQVAGIPLPSVLQLVEAERRSCTLSVASGRRRGKLYFESGRLINAFSEDFGAEGEAAAYDILSWERAAIEFERLPDTVRRMVDRSTQSLLIEVARRQDATRGVAAAATTPAAPAAWRAVPVREATAADDDAPAAAPAAATRAWDAPVGSAPDADAPAHEGLPTTAAETAAPEPPRGDAAAPAAPNPAPEGWTQEPGAVATDAPLLDAAANDAARDAHDDDRDASDDDRDMSDEDRAVSDDDRVASDDDRDPVAHVLAADTADPLWAPDVDDAASDATEPEAKGDEPTPTSAEAAAPGPAVAASNASPAAPDAAVSDASAPHADLISAIERLTRRVRDADAALAAVADEVAGFREAQRRYDEAVRRQEDRRRALDEARRDVARLARQILERMDGLFDLGADTDPAVPVFERGSPDAGGGPR